MPENDKDLKALKKLLVHPKLGEILLREKKVTLEQLTIVLKEKEENPVPIGQIFINKGFITEDDLVELLTIQENIDKYLEDCYSELEQIKNENPDK